MTHQGPGTRRWEGLVEPGHLKPRAPLALISQVAWDDVWQRPQELARGLSQHRPVAYISPVQLHQITGPLRGRWQPVRLERDDRLLILCPLILSGEYRVALVRRLNRAILTRALRPLLPRFPWIAMTNTPFLEPVIGALKAPAIAYDAIDDFCAFSWAPPEGRGLEKRLLKHADLVTAGTGALEDSLRPAAPDIAFLPSGVAVERLTTPADEPDDLRALPRPRLLYVGTMNDRLDGYLIDRVARANPNASVVLVGPRRATFDAPTWSSNVHELGLKRHEELAGYYQHCDIGLMPFANNAAARAINPVKTLEYLACGLPVISTPIPDVAKYYVPPVVVARPEDWQTAIQRLLNDDSPEERARRRAFAEGRSWDKLTEAMEQRLRALDEKLYDGARHA